MSKNQNQQKMPRGMFQRVSSRMFYLNVYFCQDITFSRRTFCHIVVLYLKSFGKYLERQYILSDQVVIVMCIKNKFKD